MPLHFAPTPQKRLVIAYALATNPSLGVPADPSRAQTVGSQGLSLSGIQGPEEKGASSSMGHTQPCLGETALERG